MAEYLGLNIIFGKHRVVSGHGVATTEGSTQQFSGQMLSLIVQFLFVIQ